PDVAQAFDRLAAAARREAGLILSITSGFRSDADQARLFAANPDPRWVARPGTSLHRLGTELDLGPPAAYGWLAANAGRFGFLKRYSWEPWHFGYTRNSGSASVGFGRRSGRRPGGDGRSSLPHFVPPRFHDMIARASQRWNVGAALLAAQIYAESAFNPFARSPAGAEGIAQFMPGTARAYGLSNSFDPAAAIDAQAHMMRDLLRRFGSVPLALAAYNAGPGAVQRCGCIPPYVETQAYVARILGLLGGAGDAGMPRFGVRLVE
ncbi:MAG TPA: transglycosylase SLT domain-containing protein, partial [Thermoleophilaceae bacterium]|nr:transglycosylase SLT domain-containing protein [Thermoleophilaceae bacterium]